MPKQQQPTKHALPYRTEWRLADGKLHRTDGPAIELPDGEKQWYQNGVLHRIDGPAVEGADGKAWYQNGKCHRTDGPAIEYPDGLKGKPSKKGNVENPIGKAEKLKGHAVVEDKPKEKVKFTTKKREIKDPGFK